MSANHIILDIKLLESFRKGLEPDPIMTVSEWSDSFRILPSESSSEPGKYRTERMPYLEEIAYELSPQSKTPEITVIKGTQLGFTELGAYASDIRTASRFTSEHLAEVDSYALPICFRTF